MWRRRKSIYVTIAGSIPGSVRWLESELIGLTPRAALADGPLEDLHLADFSESRVLESCLASTGLALDAQSRLPPSNPARQR